MNPLLLGYANSAGNLCPAFRRKHGGNAAGFSLKFMKTALWGFFPGRVATALCSLELPVGPLHVMQCFSNRGKRHWHKLTHIAKPVSYILYLPGGNKTGACLFRSQKYLQFSQLVQLYTSLASENTCALNKVSQIQQGMQKGTQSLQSRNSQQRARS